MLNLLFVLIEQFEVYFKYEFRGYVCVLIAKSYVGLSKLCYDELF